MQLVFPISCKTSYEITQLMSEITSIIRRSSHHVKKRCWLANNACRQLLKLTSGYDANKKMLQTENAPVCQANYNLCRDYDRLCGARVGFLRNWCQGRSSNSKCPSIRSFWCVFIIINRILCDAYGVIADRIICTSQEPQARRVPRICGINHCFICSIRQDHRDSSVYHYLVVCNTKYCIVGILLLKAFGMQSSAASGIAIKR